MKALSLAFKGSLGKSHTLKLNYANDNLDEASVKTAMDMFTKLDLFERDGEKLYVQPVSAKYIETTETPIFKAEKTDKPEA